MRRCTILGLSLCLMLLMAAALPAGASPREAARIIAPATVEVALPETDGALERPAIEFNHAAHVDALKTEGCAACHTVNDDGFDPALAAVVGIEGRENLTDTYHDTCMGCHNRLSREGRKGGPVTCGECHVKLGPVVSARVAPTFDLSLHARHVKAYPDDCGKCHHVWDETTQKLVHRENTEESCRGCHGEVAVDNSPSLRDAVHRDCVSCHLERAGRNEDTGPTRCEGCHDRGLVAAIKQLEEVPRLVRGQPDTVWVHGFDAKSAAVGFNHVAHEEATGSCSTCHHQTLKKCDECHTLTGSTEGAGVTLVRAYHLSSSDHSCVGCHTKKTANLQCAGCHSNLSVSPAERTCVVCHSGPASGTEGLETAPVFAELRLDSLPVVSDDFPDTVVIESLIDKYKASKLPHAKIVAKLDEITRGSELAMRFHADTGTLCSGCHHKTPVGQRPPPCRSCHPEVPDMTQDRPALKVAYHQQCLGCHIAMDLPKQGCTDCHAEVES